MATFRLSAKIISRGKGQSAVAAAAYRAGEALHSARDGDVKDYSRRDDAVLFTGIFAPADAPAWARDREELWNRVEAFEKRKDAQLAREFQIALPHEMTDQQREWLVKDFAREQFMRRGLVADVAIHAPDREGDARNFHAHFMVTLRTVDADGFAPAKDRELNSKEQLAEWREEWAKLANRHLERHGIDARIDHRSNAERGLDAEPTRYEGPAVTEMARQGIITDRRAENDDIRARNTARHQLAGYAALQAAGVAPPDLAPAPPASEIEVEQLAPPRPAPSFTPDLEWTSRGGMVAQQASANIWAREAGFRLPSTFAPQPPEMGDSAPAPTADDISRQQANDRAQLAASPIATQATEAARQGEASPAPASAPSKSAQEAERDEILAAFDRTYAASLQRRERDHEGGRELER